MDLKYDHKTKVLNFAIKNEHLVKLFAYKYTHDVGLVDEVYRESLYSVWRYADKLPTDFKDKDFFVWVSVIVKHILFQKHKREKNRHIGLRIDDKRKDETDDNRNEFLVHQEYSDGGLSDKTYLALKSLEPIQRFIMIMHTIHGYKHREISEILSMDAGSVRTTMERAKKNFKHYYKNGTKKHIPQYAKTRMKKYKIPDEYKHYLDI